MGVIFELRVKHRLHWTDMTQNQTGATSFDADTQYKIPLSSVQ